VADDTAYLSKPLPVLWITLNGQAIAAPGLPKAMRTLASIKVIQDHDGSVVTSIDGKNVTLDSPILIEGRGSSSYGIFGTFNGQRGYGIEFDDGKRNSVGAPLLGMPKNADWALVPCFSDKTCLRNAITYAIGRDMAVPAGRWAPRMRWAEVYFDGAYQGIYSVVEKAKDDKFRVNLPNVPPTTPPAETPFMISAKGDGSSFSFDPVNLDEEFLDRRARVMPPAAGNRRWKFREPNTGITAEQKAYIQGAFDKMTDAVEGTGDWKGAIDVPSWIDYYIVSEFTNNVDSFFKSWFLYKMPDGMGGKWFMGPIWDFDLAYGNTNYYFRQCATNSVLGVPAKAVPANTHKDEPPPPFVLNTLKDTAFKNDMRCRYNGLRANGAPLDIAKIEARIDAFAAHIKAAKPRDAAKWKNIGVYVWPNNYVGATWEDEVKFLKFWIRTRLAWMDAKVPGTCTSPGMPPAVMQIAAPPSVKVDRSKEAYGGEGLMRSSDYVDILSTTETPFSCPR
jgi:hypothetical protein